MTCQGHARCKTQQVKGQDDDASKEQQGEPCDPVPAEAAAPSSTQYRDKMAVPPMDHIEEVINIPEFWIIKLLSHSCPH